MAIPTPSSQSGNSHLKPPASRSTSCTEHPPPPLPVFPMETIIHIIEFVSEEPSLRSTLPKLALVCRAWNTIVQNLIYRTIDFSRFKNADSLLKLKEALDNDASIGDKVEEVFFLDELELEPLGPVNARHFCNLLFPLLRSPRALRICLTGDPDSLYENPNHPRPTNLGMPAGSDVQKPPPVQPHWSEWEHLKYLRIDGMLLDKQDLASVPKFSLETLILYGCGAEEEYKVAKFFEKSRATLKHLDIRRGVTFGTQRLFEQFISGFNQTLVTLRTEIWSSLLTFPLFPNLRSLWLLPKGSVELRSPSLLSTFPHLLSMSSLKELEIFWLPIGKVISKPTFALTQLSFIKPQDPEFFSELSALIMSSMDTLKFIRSDERSYLGQDGFEFWENFRKLSQRLVFGFQEYPASGEEEDDEDPATALAKSPLPLLQTFPWIQNLVSRTRHLEDHIVTLPPPKLHMKFLSHLLPPKNHDRYYDLLEKLRNGEFPGLKGLVIFRNEWSSEFDEWGSKSGVELSQLDGVDDDEIESWDSPMYHSVDWDRWIREQREEARGENEIETKQKESIV